MNRTRSRIIKLATAAPAGFFAAALVFLSCTSTVPVGATPKTTLSITFPAARAIPAPASSTQQALPRQWEYLPARLTAHIARPARHHARIRHVHAIIHARATITARIRYQRVSTPAAPAAYSSPERAAAALITEFGWSASEYACLYPLWERESGWNLSAYNASTGAYGIPQALPGSKMASAGPDWQSSAATQIRWGLQYIRATYGSPCGAWSHEQADGWY